MKASRFAIDTSNPQGLSFKIDNQSVIDFIQDKLKEFTGRNVPWREKRSLLIDFVELRQSLNENGDYTIFTCQCGVAECVGVGVVSVNLSVGDTLKWTFKLPTAPSTKVGESLALVEIYLSKTELSKELKRHEKEISHEIERMRKN